MRYSANPDLARAPEVGRRREAEPEIGEEQQESRARDKPRHLRQLPRRRRPALLRSLPRRLPPAVLVHHPIYTPHLFSPLLSNSPCYTKKKTTKMAARTLKYFTLQVLKSGSEDPASYQHLFRTYLSVCKVHSRAPGGNP